MTTVFFCTDQQASEVADLVGPDLAAYVCTNYDCSANAVACVLRYMAAQQQDLGEGLKDTAKAEVGLGELPSRDRCVSQPPPDPRRPASDPTAPSIRILGERSLFRPRKGACPQAQRG
jgi:hypothetical protein